MEKVFELFLGFCCMFGFGMICIVALSTISNFIDSFKRWNKNRKIQREKSCNTCVCGYPSKACDTCKRNPNYLDNYWTRDGFDRR